jgi:hypothetical protein
MPLVALAALRKPLQRAVFAIVVMLIVTSARRADAYAWMIRHGVTDCQTCHADPSGGGVLTRFGRLVGNSTLRTLYGRGDNGANDDFLSLLPLPDPVLLGGDARYFWYTQKTKSPGSAAQGNSDNFLMQADLTGQVKVWRLRANASIGYADKGARYASITTATEQNLVSRVHWVGVDLGEHDQFLVRAGRMNLPFGVRSVEHTMLVRSVTQTDTNEYQQDGVALAFNAPHWRGEVMAILGNYQISPDVFRQRGYSAYLEYAPLHTLAFGVSSETTHANFDQLLNTEAIRQNHGVFARYSPWWPLVFTGEYDLTFTSQPPSAFLGAINKLGFVGMLQGDLEVVQGIHVMATGEMQAQPTDGGFPSVGGWASAWWFFAPHADVRLDGILQSLPSGTERTTVGTIILQGHVYL